MSWIACKYAYESGAVSHRINNSSEIIRNTNLKKTQKRITATDKYKKFDCKKLANWWIQRLWRLIPWPFMLGSCISASGCDWTSNTHAIIRRVGGADNLVARRMTLLFCLGDARGGIIACATPISYSLSWFGWHMDSDGHVYFPSVIS